LQILGYKPIKNFKKNDKVVIVAGTPPNQEAANKFVTCNENR
jgi:hypothetical protein